MNEQNFKLELTPTQVIDLMVYGIDPAMEQLYATLKSFPEKNKNSIRYYQERIEFFETIRNMLEKYIQKSVENEE